MKIATWNINSARLRLPIIERLLRETQPDALCLQETKSPVEKLPQDAFAAAGYPHVVARGEPGYNGVAILSRHPLEERASFDFCGKGDARHVAADLHAPGADPITLHNLYVPAGGDTPDLEANDKFAHKLDFVAEMAERLADRPERSVAVGDFNIAPLEHDVWSHKQLLKVVSHTPVEVARFEAAQRAGSWVDACRAVTPAEEKLYSWWSYRARDWRKSDRGRRLDHIWLPPSLGERLKTASILKDARGWEQPSDHAPVFAELALSS